MNIITSFMALMILSDAATTRKPSTIPFDANLQTVFQSLKLSKSKDVLDFIELLDAKYFETNNYALIFKTMSIQPATKKHPRVLFFNKDKTLRVGFNHKLGGDKNIDLIHWKKKRESVGIKRNHF